MAYSSRLVSFLPMEVARAKGFYRQEGIDVKTIMAKSNLYTAALATGEMDYSLGYYPSIRAALQGAPLKLVAILVSRPQHVLVTLPEYTSLPQLKGRKLGVNAVGDTGDVIIREIFRHSGLDPSAPAVIAVGGETERLAAMSKKAIDGAIVTHSGAVLAVQQGFRILVNASDMLNLPLLGLTVNETKLQIEREQVKRMIRAMLKSVRFIRRDKPGTVKTMMEWLNMSRNNAEAIYDLSLNSWEESGEVNDRIIEQTIEDIRRAGNIQKAISVSKVVDYSLLREVKRELPAEK